jgi:hypothetical protein
MSSPLEITGEDISQLDDSSLRELIGLLCEAEFRRQGRSASAVTWGGDQNAPDGGFDVVVEAEQPFNFQGFLRGHHVAFQVKKPKMPRGEILKEMAPKGVLRDSIKELIGKTGSYIIVSSGDSVTKPAFDARRRAMREAIIGEADYEKTTLDFLDRNRVATWVREHPSYILWVRDRVGRQIHGWQAYGNWAHSPGGVDDEYLIDESVRLHTGIRTPGSDEGLTIVDGLRKVRSASVYRNETPR